MAGFLGVKLMFVGIVNFGHVPTLSFVGVNFFRSNSNQFGHIDLVKITSLSSSDVKVLAMKLQEI